MIVEIEDKVAVEKEREAEYEGSKPENATPTFTTKDGEQKPFQPNTATRNQDSANLCNNGFFKALSW